MSHRILVLPGDGIGPEIIAEGVKVLTALSRLHGIEFELIDGKLGGSAYDAHGDPFPEATREAARAADAILLGAVGGPKWDSLDRPLRPETGLLRLRSELGVFANLRPAILYASLADASALKPDVVSDLDIMIVRELTGGIYFGEPRGIRTKPGSNEREGFNTLVYSESEIERIVRVGFDLAMKRDRRLCSVDKANVLEVSVLWREVADQVARDYPDVELSHLYVDNAAMQLVRTPKQFDVIVTTNMFGDILSDLAAMLTGSIGMLPSAALDENAKGLYEPIHGAAPDIAGRGIANPLATILSVAMMMRYSLDRGDLAEQVEGAVGDALAAGHRTADIAGGRSDALGTAAMGDAIVGALQARAS